MGPGVYERWRASRLGSVTEALEQTRILDLVGPVEGSRILDVGCGDGLLTWTLAERNAWVVGIDTDRAMLEAATARLARGRRQRPRFVEGRIEQLPFPDGSFDVVVIVTVLCLLEDRAGAVREAARVLRPGGRLVIGDLGRWSAWAARRRVKAWLGSTPWQSAHFSTASELSRLAERAGLTVENMRGSVYYPPIGLLARPSRVWIGGSVPLQRSARRSSPSPRGSSGSENHGIAIAASENTTGSDGILAGESTELAAFVCGGAGTAFLR